MYDVIVVGTRLAGAATAMLLARAGARVLAVDQAAFPSDTLSTHQMQVPGVSLLKRWGLLDRITFAGTPATTAVSFAVAGSTIRGRMPVVDGADALFSPRRTLLDKILVDAAVAAGVELRQRFVVEGLVREGERVVGIEGREKGGVSVVERASIVVGADGKSSLVARAGGARVLVEADPQTVAMYAYWQGFEQTAGEMHSLPGASVGVWPTNDGLTLIFVSRPRSEFRRDKAERTEDMLATIDRCGDLGERVRSARLAETIRATIDVPNLVRMAHGAGWALAGDARAVIDPLTGQGMTHALKDAELLAGRLAAALGGTTTSIDAALAGYHRRRYRDLMPMFRLTVGLARHRPASSLQKAVYRALASRPEDSDRFFAVTSGAVAPSALFNPVSIARLLLRRRGSYSASNRSAVPA